MKIEFLLSTGIVFSEVCLKHLNVIFFMASKTSVIPIRSLRVCLFSFKTRAVQEKFIAKLVNSEVNFTRKIDIGHIAL